MKKVVIPFLFLSFVSVYAQNAEELEQRYREMRRIIQIEQNTLDSLNRIMETTADLIENEKRSSAPDQKKIVQWMAHGVTLSARIKEFQKKIAELQGFSETLRQRLEANYTRSIDSLRRLEKNKSGKADRNVIQDQIIRLTEKRILVSPVVKALAFDPQEVRRIDPAEAKDPLEKTMMTDYLNKALAEIDAHLQSIADSREEYESVASLRKQAMEFVSESYEQGRIGTISRTQTVKSEVTSGLGGPLSGDFTTVQARSVVGLMQQLNSGIRLSSAPFANINPKQGITESEYIELLKQAEEQLKSYRELVQKKLK
jgi:hypothetical protein